MLIGIIGAMQVEVAVLLKCMEIDSVETISMIDYYCGRINGHRVVLAKCGPGKVNAAICAQTLIVKFSPQMMINTGVAGGLTAALKTGDCAIASSVVQYDVDTTGSAEGTGTLSPLHSFMGIGRKRVFIRKNQAVK